MSSTVLKIPQCLQQAEIIFDKQNPNEQIFLGKSERPYLTAFVEIRLPLPECMETIEVMDLEIQKFFHNMTDGFLVVSK